jgi:hypothetical protein
MGGPASSGDDSQPSYRPLEQQPQPPHAQPHAAAQQPAAFGAVAGGYQQQQQQQQQQQHPALPTFATIADGGGGGVLQHGLHAGGGGHDRYRGGGGSVAASVAACPRGRLSGNTVTLCGGGGGATSFPRVAMVGPDWPCLCITYGMVLGPATAFLAFVAPHLHAAVVAVGAVWVCVALAALSLTACSNPGYLRKQSPADLAEARRSAEEAGREAQVTVCAYCNVLREARTSHCYECNLCVLELDHHW